MGGKNSFFKKPLGKSGITTPAGMVVGSALDATTPAGVPNFKLSAADQARSNAFAEELDKDIAGEGDSLAIDQYKRAQEDNNKNALALSQSTRGVSNPALLNRNVSMAADNQGQELAQASSTARMMERQNALNAMNSYLAAQRGVALNQQQMKFNADTAAKQNQAQMLGSAGSALVALSDENKKENIKKSESKASDKVNEFLDALESYSFDYKDKENGEGNKSGVMAQDLEKSDLGKQMVKETPEGKVVDFAQGFGAILAAQAELNKEIKEMKKKKGK